MQSDALEQPGAGLILSPSPALSRHWLECMRRDGLLVPIGASRYLCADAAGWPLVRRLALRTEVPRGCVVVGLTAAWALGAPVRPQALTTLTVNAVGVSGLTTPPGLTVRRTAIPPTAVLQLDGLLLTTPVRTAGDLAMIPGPETEEALRWMLGPGGAPADQVLGSLRRRGRARGVRRAALAVERIASTDQDAR